MRRWRAEKASSGESGAWKESCRRMSAEWRKKHQAYLRVYREEHKEDRAKYMKEYMRQYRKRNRAVNRTEDTDKPGSVL